MPSGAEMEVRPADAVDFQRQRGGFVVCLLSGLEVTVRISFEESAADALSRSLVPPFVYAPVGRWMVAHYRVRAVESGTQAAARQMRKQGVPIDRALLVLTGRAS